MAAIGIRREEKNKWERRVPLIPEHVKYIKDNFSLDICLQPSAIRIFKDEDYIKAGARIQEDLKSCSIIFGVKEMPHDFFQPEKTYVFFSHTIKGQQYNMPMLKKMMKLNCNLIDYERIVDEFGKRLIFFGRYAGLAGMIDAFWAFGKKLGLDGIHSPFDVIKKTYMYDSLEDVKSAVAFVSENIKKEGMPEEMVPFVCGFTGYGNVSMGAQEIFDLLPVEEIRPAFLKSFMEKTDYSDKVAYKVVFKEEDIMEPVLEGDKFQLQDYYSHPEKYRSVFEEYIPHLTLIMNCVYWDNNYPRLVSKKYIKELFSKDEKPRLKVIGDISCDINGSIEFTEKTTISDNPTFVYNPFKDAVTDGNEGEGVVVMAVDNLPCELPKEASVFFSTALKDLVHKIFKADYSVDFKDLNLPENLKKAVIVYKGRLTPAYKYMEKYIS